MLQLGRMLDETTLTILAKLFEVTRRPQDCLATTMGC